MAGIWEWLQEAWGITDLVRARLPWHWQPVVSNWLIWSGILFTGSIMFLIAHFFLREKPKVDWQFLSTGNPLSIGTSRTIDGAATQEVHGIVFSGKNVSGHSLHQVYGEITLHRDGRKLPLFIHTTDGAIVPSEDVDTIPSRASLSLGGELRSDTPHWPGLDQPMSPEQFLQNVGGFSVEISVDGAKQKWSFSIDQLRNAIAARRRQDEDDWAARVPPAVRRRAK